MSGFKGGILAVVGLWIATALQLSLSKRLSIGPASPDFLLVLLSCMGLFCDRKGATLLGFGAGLTQGAIAGANMTLYILSRSVTGFLLGWFNLLEVEGNLALAVLTTFTVTLLGQLILMFLGIHHGPLAPYLAGTLGSAVYNGVIAVPVYALCRKLLAQPNR